MKKFLLSIILAILFIAPSANAEFFPDVIVTSPHGIWTDSRAYASLSAAINAVGSLQRTIVVVSQQSVGNITIPSNVTLKFERDGAIIHSGQLIFNTKNIIAENRQIFAGAGDIDFAVGSVVKSGWFSNLDKALDVTNDDTLVMVISKAETTTADMAVGDNVTLRWESPFIISAAVGHTVSNLKNIEAGNYQIFAGAGDFDFLDGTRLNLSWFLRLRLALTWVENEEVTIVVSGTNTVSFNDTVPSNICLDLLSEKGVLSIDGGVTLIVEGTVLTESITDFAGAGTVDYSNASFIIPSTGSGVGYVVYVTEYANDFDDAIAGIGATETTLVINADCEMSVNTVVPATLGIEVLNGSLIDIDVNDLTINGPFKAGLFRVFSGTGGVSFGLGSILESYPQWWDSVADGISTDDEVAINKAILASRGLIVKLPPSANNYVISSPIIMYRTRLIGSGTSANYKTKIFLSNNSDCNVIQNDDWGVEASWWHWGEIAYLSIDGNKANQASGSGIAIFRMGEAASIHHVQISNAKEYGIRIKGMSAPCRITDLGVFDSGIAAYYMEAGSSVISLRGLSGDNNNIFLRVSGTQTVVLESPKIEGSHDPIFDLRPANTGGYRAGFTVIGGYANGAGTDVVKITSAAASHNTSVMFINSRVFGYTNFINDIDTGTIITLASISNARICNGIYSYDADIDMLGGDLFLPFLRSLYGRDSTGAPIRMMMHGWTGVFLTAKGSDGWGFLQDGMSGAMTYLSHKTTELTCNGATETWANAIPAGAIVLAVTARVTELVTGATSIDVGDADTDLFVDGMGVALNTTADVENSNAAFIGPKAYQSATDIVATGIGGAFTAGKLRLILHYLNFGAPTS